MYIYIYIKNDFAYVKIIIKFTFGEFRLSCNNEILNKYLEYSLFILSQ